MKAHGKVEFTKGGPVYPSVARAIRKLGADISLARRARKMTAEEFAAAMSVSRATLYRLEHGDAGISLNTLAMALNALGRMDALSNLVDETKDDITLMSMRDAIPKRVVRKRRPRSSPGQEEGGDDTPLGDGW